MDSAWGHRGSCYGGDPADLNSNVEGRCPGSSIFDGGDVVSTKMKEIVDLIMGGEETLGLAR